MAVDQMKDMKMEWVLIGHSERRGEFGLETPPESSEFLAKKLSYVRSLHQPSHIPTWRCA